MKIPRKGLLASLLVVSIAMPLPLSLCRAAEVTPDNAVQSKAALVAAERAKALDSLVEEVSAKVLAHAPASAFDSFLKRLVNLSVVPGQYNDPEMLRLEGVRSFVMKWQDYLLLTAQGNSEQAASALAELIQLSSRVPIAPRSELLALQSEGAKRAAAGSDLGIDRFEALRKKLENTLDSASHASDLDVVLIELSKAVRSKGSFSSSIAIAQLDALHRYARRWQDYFSALDSGNESAAMGALRELANDTSTDQLYPRSRILARLASKDPVQGPGVDANEALLSPDELTVETLEKLVRQLAAKRARFSHATLPLGFDEMQSEVVRLGSVANQLASGNVQPALELARSQAFLQRGGMYSASLIKIQQTLLFRALTSSLNPSPDIVISPKDSPGTYLKKIFDRGRETKDWTLVYGVLDISANYPALVTVPGLATDLLAYRLFLLGVNQEKARQWSLAVCSYTAALKVSSPHLPLEEISRSLEAIKKDYPKEFEAGKAMEYSDGAQAMQGMFPGRYPNPGMNPANMRPNGPVQTGPRPTGPAMNGSDSSSTAAQKAPEKP